MSGPQQNPNPQPVPGYDPLAGAAGVSASSRSPSCPLGRSRATIVAIRAHNGADSGAGPGTLVDVEIDGNPCGWRIQLGGKWPKYGIKDMKRLLAACMNLSEHDPRITAADAPELRAMQADPTPYAGREIMVDVFENLKPEATTGRPKIDKATGKPYLTVIPSAIDGTGTITGGSPTSSAPAAPPPVPATPRAPAGPPAGWFECPEGHPNRGTHWYNASGYREIGA